MRISASPRQMIGLLTWLQLLGGPVYILGLTFDLGILAWLAVGFVVCIPGWLFRYVSYNVDERKTYWRWRACMLPQIGFFIWAWIKSDNCIAVSSMSCAPFPDDIRNSFMWLCLAAIGCVLLDFLHVWLNSRGPLLPETLLSRAGPRSEADTGVHNRSAQSSEVGLFCPEVGGTSINARGEPINPCKCDYCGKVLKTPEGKLAHTRAKHIGFSDADGPRDAADIIARGWRSSKSSKLVSYGSGRRNIVSDGENSSQQPAVVTAEAVHVEVSESSTDLHHTGPVVGVVVVQATAVQ